MKLHGRKPKPGERPGILLGGGMIAIKTFLGILSVIFFVGIIIMMGVAAVMETVHKEKEWAKKRKSNGQ